MSSDADFVLGAIVDRLVVRPLHRLAWATGVALLLALSLGRFQVQPFGAETWTPEPGRAPLYIAPATALGIAAWSVSGLALLRHHGL